LQLGGGDILPVALKPLRIVTQAFVTFPEYMWSKNAEKMSDISSGIFFTAAGKWITNYKRSKILC